MANTVSPFVSTQSTGAQDSAAGLGTCPPNQGVPPSEGGTQLCVYSPGHGPVPATRQQILEAAQRLLYAELKATGIESPKDSAAFLKARIGSLEREVFCAIYLDAQHKVIDFEVLFYGTLSQTSVYPREVVKSALARNAAAMIVAHNHPSGCTEPSRADEYLTNTLKSALNLVDVRLLDHIVVGASGTTSLAERGLV